MRSSKRLDVKDRKTCVRTPLSEFRKKCALFQQQPRKIGAIARSGLQKRAKIWHTQNIRRKRTDLGQRANSTFGIKNRRQAAG